MWTCRLTDCRTDRLWIIIWTVTSKITKVDLLVRANENEDNLDNLIVHLYSIFLYIFTPFKIRQYSVANRLTRTVVRKSVANSMHTNGWLLIVACGS